MVVIAKVSWKPKVYSEAELAEKAKKQEMEKLLHIWSLVDVDGSGLLDVDELREVVVLLGMAEVLPNGEAKPIDMTKIMAQVDADGSGAVDLDEFANFWLGLDTEQRETAVTKAKANVLAPAVLEVQIVSARKLKRMDKLKQNDVFCIISVPPPNPPIALTEVRDDRHEIGNLQV